MDRTVEPGRRRARWIRIAVVVVALGLRVWNLGSPPQTVFDEAWYTFDAVASLGGGGFAPAPVVGIDGDSTPQHPPLGKWLIAAGMGPYSEPIGWRLPSMVFGVAGVLLVYLPALASWRSPGWAGLAGLLVAFDGVHCLAEPAGHAGHRHVHLHHRFMSTFITGGVRCAVLEYQRRRGMPVPAVAGNRVFGSRYLLGTGMLLGAAAATKWTGLFTLVPVVLLG